MRRASIALAVVLATAVVGTSSGDASLKQAGRLPVLKAWVGGRGTDFIGISTVTWHGRLVRHLRPGRYTLLISDPFAAFRLVGPNIDRTNTPTGNSSTSIVTWKIRLVRGGYAYAAVGIGEKTRYFTVR